MTTLYDSEDLLWFENISPLNEPIFPVLGFGMLNIKQIAMLGIGIMLSWNIWQKTGDYLAFIPVVFVLILVIKKENVMPTELKIIKILMFHIISRHNSVLKNTPSVKNIKKTHHSFSSKLSVAKQYRINSNSKPNHKSKTQNIHYIYDRMFRMKIRLNEDDISIGTQVKIVLDGVVYGTARTDSNHEIVVSFMPDHPGKILLQVYADAADSVHEEVLNFTR